MMRMSKVEAQALAAFVGRIRPDWQQPGIVAAIEKAAHLGSAAAVGAALCRLAENYDLRTPALLPEPGPHWGGTSVASRTPPAICPHHPDWKAARCDVDGPCSQTVGPPTDAYKAARDALRQRTRPASDRREPAPSVDEDSRARARERAQEETA